MGSSRRQAKGRVRTFGDITLAVAHVEGEPQGSRISTGNGSVWELPQWPSRITDVKATEGGVVVAFKDGRKRLLENSDAITQGAANGLDAVRKRLKRAFREEAVESYKLLLESYLALNGDTAPVQETTHEMSLAIRRVVTGKGPADPLTPLDARVMEAQRRLTTPREVTKADENLQELHRFSTSLIKYHLHEAETEHRRLPLEKVIAGVEHAEQLLEAMGPGKATYKKGTLERVPGKQNWVDKAGGLPRYIERIAAHIHYEKGMPIGRAIAIAVNACKKMCASGDTNLPGYQQVNAGSRAAACKAVAEWEKKKASRHEETAVEVMPAANTVYEPYDRGPVAEPEPERVVADPLGQAPLREHRPRPTMIQEGEWAAVGEARRTTISTGDHDDLREQALELYEASGGATSHGRQHIRTAGRAELTRIIDALSAMGERL